MPEDPQARFFSPTDDNFKENFCEFRKLLVVDFEYKVITSMCDAFKKENLRLRLQDFLFDTKIQCTRKVSKRPLYNSRVYDEEMYD